ncbi:MULTISPECIES: TRAP transporter small permease [Proteiniclasticum]|jgi:TRAP-type C4-dicarboxylate transport system permease small subunit|uniref:TRAP-type C4-dicarboxylate transport system, small permease component n=1 Tax=Proteiniclasticum ruminis TaxID=398199 RepID=A0A1I4YXU5_9CLOT|nr:MULTISPECIES: TRAP transporter small permease [Proteiniclasticum]SFN42822.1 TRAP-type C4-dicarboxylate transport system, small permease component [Proteiniclasticum ruminis]HBW13759.1 TRAP transporter small permease [Proteiniclasticum sp.]
MKGHLRNFFVHFELIIGSVFLSITSVLVLINVFTRYFLRFTFNWTEEVAVGAFVWVIFLGLASAYKTKGLIGIEVLTNLVPDKYQPIVLMITSSVVTVLSGTMFYLSFLYFMNSTKITAALELSYKFIYVAIVISFGLITIYSIYFLVQSIRKVFLKRDVKLEIGDPEDQGVEE